MHFFFVSLSGTSSNSQVLGDGCMQSSALPRASQQFSSLNFLIGWEPLFSGPAVYLSHDTDDVLTQDELVIHERT
jgi:hypothetical protein